MHPTTRGVNLAAGVEDPDSARWNNSEDHRNFVALSRAILEPVEDGVTHPAEELLAQFVRSTDRAFLVKWTFEPRTPTADVLRLLGRLDSVAKDSRFVLVRRGLESDDLEVRDAAVQASESWSDPQLGELLRAHQEPTAWLADYAARVADDILGGPRQ